MEVTRNVYIGIRYRVCVFDAALACMHSFKKQSRDHGRNCDGAARPRVKSLSAPVEIVDPRSNGLMAALRPGSVSAPPSTQYLEAPKPPGSPGRDIRRLTCI